jgi:serine/threonine protein kinase
MTAVSGAMPEYTSCDERYQIDRKIGDGAYANVYKVWDSQREKYCALKKGFELSPTEVYMMKREADVQQKLSHAVSTVPRVHDYYFKLREQNSSYIAMDLVDFQNTHTMYVKGKDGFSVLSEADIFKIAGQALQSIAVFAQNGVLHLDFKPGNLIYDPTIGLKILDFGGHLRLKNGKYQSNEMYIQTRSYRSPDAVFGGEINVNTDLWSLGCTLFELYTKKTLMNTGGESEANDLIKAGELQKTHLALIISTLGQMPPLSMIQKTNRWKDFFDCDGNIEDGASQLRLKNQCMKKEPTRSIRERMYDEYDERQEDDLCTDDSEYYVESLIQLIEGLVSYDGISIDCARAIINGQDSYVAPERDDVLTKIGVSVN